MQSILCSGPRVSQSQSTQTISFNIQYYSIMSMFKNTHFEYTSLFASRYRFFSGWAWSRAELKILGVTQISHVWDSHFCPALQACLFLKVEKFMELSQSSISCSLNILCQWAVKLCKIMWKQQSSHGQPRKGNHGTFTQKDEDVLSAICHSPSHGKGDETGSDDLAL